MRFDHTSPFDIGLPVMDGYELARRLRSEFEAIRAGFRRPQIKPVAFEALHAALGDPAHLRG